MNTNLSCAALSINFCSNSWGVSYNKVIDIVFCYYVSYMLCRCWLTLLLLKLLWSILPFRLILLIIKVLSLISIVWNNGIIAFLIFIQNFIRCNYIFHFYLVISRYHISIFFLFLFEYGLLNILSLLVIDETLVIEIDHPLFLGWLAALLALPSILLLTRLKF